MVAVDGDELHIDLISPNVGYCCVSRLVYEIHDAHEPGPSRAIKTITTQESDLGSRSVQQSMQDRGFHLDTLKCTRRIIGKQTPKLYVDLARLSVAHWLESPDHYSRRHTDSFLPCTRSDHYWPNDASSMCFQFELCATCAELVVAMYQGQAK